MCARVAFADTCARVATLDMYAIVCQPSYMYARPHICASVAAFSGPASPTQTYQPASPTQTCQPVSPTQTIRWEVQAIQWGGLGGRQGLYRGALLAAKERGMCVCVRVCVCGRDRDRARARGWWRWKAIASHLSLHLTSLAPHHTSHYISPRTSSTLSCTAPNLSFHLTSQHISPLGASNVWCTCFIWWYEWVMSQSCHTDIRY